MGERLDILRKMKICRFCMSNDEPKLTNIYDAIKRDMPPLPLQIMACASIEVYKNDGMPQYICSECREQTNQAYIFKTNCKKTDDALKSFLLTGLLNKPILRAQVQKKKQSQQPVQLEPEIPEKSQPPPLIPTQPPKKFTIVRKAEANETVPPPKIIKIEEQHHQEIITLDITDNVLEDEEEQDGDTLEDEEEEEEVRQGQHADEIILGMDEKSFPETKESRERAEKPFFCRICRRGFSKESVLRTHQRTHPDLAKFICATCQKPFTTEADLCKHQSKHRKQRGFSCTKCDKSFVFKQGLDRHILTHGQSKPHKCTYCEASFSSNVKLVRHITSHEGLRPYPCKVCGRTFLLSHHLTRHMKSHHAANKDEYEIMLPTYKCHICSMAFKRKDSLINHSAIHSMVNLKCVICGATFMTANDVKEHIGTHLTGLPFCCQKCDYSFETNDQLEEHQIVHVEMEYEEQIEKEIAAEKRTNNGEDSDELEYDTEALPYVPNDQEESDVDNEQQGNRATTSEKEKQKEPETDKNTTEKETPAIEFLKQEIDSDGEEFHETPDEIILPDHKADISIKPIVRPENTRVYTRKDKPKQPPIIKNTEEVAPIRVASLEEITQPKVVTEVPRPPPGARVQRLVITKEEMKQMAKKGLITIKNGMVRARGGSTTPLLNAISLKRVPKAELDSLIAARPPRAEVKQYSRAVPSFIGGTGS